MMGTVTNDCERAYVYKVLAECYHPPDEKLLATLGDFGEAAGGALSKLVQSAPPAGDLERHAVDFSSLFLGPFKLLAPPYGSVYLEDGKFMGNSTLEVRELYRQEGLDIALKDAPDHISAELEFIYFLALKEAEARENSDLKQAECLRSKQASFLQTHLGQWIEAFTQNIEKNAQTNFYKIVAYATMQLVSGAMRKLSGSGSL